MRLGVCYYPEQWSSDLWREDARRMADLGLAVVRIGEFAWSKIEPNPGRYEWEWLDDSIGVLGDAGLKVILGTPTATPPKWLVDAHPEILACDSNGQPRRFGSRRHYCFSSQTYRKESKRIVTAMAKRYGANETVEGWQTDNEFGCHDTVRSYSRSAAAAFRNWLKRRYGDVGVLNDAWGTVFWAQSYRSFDEVDLPNLTVTEPNPSHVLDYYRFSSDQVAAYNRMQAEIIRAHAPGRDIYHNFMGWFSDFDHFRLANDIDVAGWDSYPLGFLDIGPHNQDDKRDYMRQGHPDFAAFHHDLYRNCGRGRFAVLEQQPGPVNWAANNPAPLDGMVRLWTHEAAAHGAELLCYFRWRQAAFAQEQMHAGLLRRDDRPAPAFAEVKRARAELADLTAPARNAPTSSRGAKAALIFSYETDWMSSIQPQGAGWNYRKLTMDWYSAARRLGCDIDIVEPGAALTDFDAVLVPSLFHISDAVLETFQNADAEILFGPRTGSKTKSMQIPSNLAPGPLQSLIPLKVLRSESFPDFHQERGVYADSDVCGRHWLDDIESNLQPLASTQSGKGLLYRKDRYWLFAACPDQKFLAQVLSDALDKAGAATVSMPRGVRVKRSDAHCYAFNYGAVENSLPGSIAPDQERFLIGAHNLKPAAVAVWRR